MKVKEFLIIFKKDNVFEILKDDQIIENLVNIFKKFDKENINNINKMNDSMKIPIISNNVILKG